MELHAQKVLVGALLLSLFATPPSLAEVICGYNTDGSPKYCLAPQGPTGPIATPENPSWVPNSDGTYPATKDSYTFLPDAEAIARNATIDESDLNSKAPPGQIQIGFNVDGSAKFGPAPQGPTGPIATPENPNWIPNPDGTYAATSEFYVFLPNADEEIMDYSLTEIKSLVSNEISSSQFKRSKKAKTFIFMSTTEMSVSSPFLKVIAKKKGAKNKEIPVSYNEEGQLVIKVSDKYKSYQLQIIDSDKVLKKISM